jgi:hypothetical protein
VTNSINKFFASKKAGLAMALLALVIVLASQFSFLPPRIRSILNALSIGFVLWLIGFTRAFSEDWNRHKPWGKELLSRAFFITYLFFILILTAIVAKDLFFKK